MANLDEVARGVATGLRGAETTINRGEWRVEPSFSRRTLSVRRLRRFCLLSTQLFAALGAAAFDDLLAGFGGHAGTEAVFAGVFNFLGLKDSFWHSCHILHFFCLASKREKLGKCFLYSFFEV